MSQLFQIFDSQQKPEYGTILNPDWRADYGLAAGGDLWAFNEGSGSVVHGLANGNNGTLNGGVTWSGGGLKFDGTSGYIQAASIDPFGNKSKGTLIIWFSSNSNAPGIIGGTVAGSAGLPFAFAASAGSIAFRTLSQTNGYVIPSVTTSWATGKIHMVAGIYDGTTSSLYFDGILSQSLSQHGLIQATSNGFSCAWNGNYAGFSDFLGSIYAAFAFPLALSARQIQSLYTDPYGWAAPTLGEQGVAGVSGGNTRFPYPLLSGGGMGGGILTGGRMAA